MFDIKTIIITKKIVNNATKLQLKKKINFELNLQLNDT